MKKLIFTCLILFQSFSLSAAENNWTLIKNEDGIQVFTRKLPNSKLKTFKGVVSIPASLTSIVKVIDDTKNYPHIFYSTKKAKELKRVSQFEVFKYMLTSLPWPAKDRDSIIHSVLKQDKKTKAIQITMSSKPNFIPKKAGRVRIQNIHGRWLLIPEKSNKKSSIKKHIKVTYEMSIDPGGNLPAWIVNNMLVDFPFETLKNLRAGVKLPRYQGKNTLD